MINDMIVSDYFSKNTDFSSTDFCTPSYQLWVKKNLEKNEDDEQNFKAWVGQLIHKASYDTPEVDVIKEFSFKVTFDLQHTIGGSIDRLSFVNGMWVVEDIKTMGNFPAQKAFKDGKEEWVIQLSIYAWAMRRYGLLVSNYGVIHQYVMGYQKNKNSDMQEYNKIIINLMSDSMVEELLHRKISIALGDKPLIVDCPTYLCKDYCSYNKSCPSYKGV
jgi:hypothetical protein